ncbi:AEC family transporter [Pseudomonas sp. F1_0610]|uniref:AEC family transporter n=1 Tax=Pseudomonas sp. F1_0610 TaxID=3114284 RepID=UPI0039C22CAD
MDSLLFLAIGLGVITRRFLNAPENMVACVNWWLIHIALPCVVIRLMPALDLAHASLYPILAMWVAFVVGALVLAAIGRAFNWSRATVCTVILVGGIGNTAFFGYPIVSSYYADQGLAIAVLSDQLGTFIILSTFGLALLAIGTGQKLTAKSMFKQVMSFPPMFALIIGLTVNFTYGPLPAWIDQPLSKMAATLSPLALFSVGMQIKLKVVREELLPIFVGIGWKLIFAPLVVVALGYAVGAQTLAIQVTALEAGMSTMIVAVILAQRAGLKGDLAVAILGYSIIASFATLPAIHYLLS